MPRDPERARLKTITVEPVETEGSPPSTETAVASPPRSPTRTRANRKDGPRSRKKVANEGQPHISSDAGNAERLIDAYGNDLLFVAGLGWHVWTGTHWRKDVTGEVTRWAIERMRAQTLDATESTESDRKQRIQEALKCENAPRIKGLLELSKVDARVAVDGSELDKDPWLLNVANGTLDLRTGTLKPHRREDHISHVLDVPYDPAATCPDWKAFLDRVLQVGDGSHVDSVATENLKTFMQRAVGYSLTGSTREQCLFLLYGRGANGKSVFLGVISNLLGPLAQTVPFETFLHKLNGAGIPNDVARLRGIRFATAIEAESGRRFAESKLKQLTGSDTVAARFLRNEYFQFDPRFKLWFACNHRPEVRGTDHAMWRRLRLVPFTQVIPPDEQDKNLKDRLVTKELPGILRWAVDGCLEWQRGEGLGEPEAVALATIQFRQEQDVFGAFVAQECVVGPSCKVTSGALTAAYNVWAKRNGERELTAKGIACKLQEWDAPVASCKIGQARGWRGIGLSFRGGEDR